MPGVEWRVFLRCSGGVRTEEMSGVAEEAFLSAIKLHVTGNLALIRAAEEELIKNKVSTQRKLADSCQWAARTSVTYGPSHLHQALHAGRVAHGRRMMRSGRAVLAWW